MKRILLAIVAAIMVFSLAAVSAGGTLPPLINEDGSLNCTIVVGATAAASDIMGATQIAVHLTQLSYQEVILPVPRVAHEVTHEAVPLGTTTVDDPSTLPTLTWEDMYPWGDMDGVFDSFETHEEIKVTTSDILELTAGVLAPDGYVEIVGGEQTALPGVLYLIDNIRVPPHIWVDMGYPTPGPFHTVDLDWYDITSYPLVTPFMSQPQFHIFGELYNVVDAGYLADCTKYGQCLEPSEFFIFTGDAKYTYEEYLQVGDIQVYDDVQVYLRDVDVDHNRAFLEVSTRGGVGFSGVMVLDPEHGFSPGLLEAGTTGQPLSTIVIGRAQYDCIVLSLSLSYEDEEGILHYQYLFPYFVLDGINVFVGASGNFLLQYNVYQLSDWYVFKDMPCCIPFSTSPYNYSLKIFQSTTLMPDTPFDFQESPFPEPFADYDHADNLDGADYLYEMSVGLCDVIFSPVCDSPFTVLGPQNWWMGLIERNLDGPYFTINFEDTSVDGGINYTVSMQESSLVYTQRNSVEGTNLVLLDTEFPFWEWRGNADYQTRTTLILIGGPEVNYIVSLLVEEGLSTVDWYNSPGDMETIYEGKLAIVIIAGKWREQTASAIKAFLDGV